MPAGEGGHVVVVGCGGNIGSHLCSLLARLPEVHRLTLVDPEVYTSSDAAAQDVTPAEAGQPKVRVRARRLRAVRPGLTVTALQARAEEVPWGLLRSAVLCACVDTRLSRMFCNEVAWRLGIPWVDAGVSGAALLARVDVYVPSGSAACLECGFGESHYTTMEFAYPCRGKQGRAAPPTGAPAYLGALAAALQAAECRKLLRGEVADSLAGRQVLVDLRHHAHLVTAHSRSHACRFDHEIYCIEAPAGAEQMTVAQALGRAGYAGPQVAEASLRVPGRFVALRWRCAGCGAERPGPRFAPASADGVRPCGRCGGAMAAGPLDMCDELRAVDLPRRALQRPLRGLGLRPGDVFTVRGAGGERHFELPAAGALRGREGASDG
jgi:molybdopterin-synthase adenylyltransferase